MIEINTIQDIRNIESKLIGGFSARQLISFVIGGIAGGLMFLITKSMFLTLITATIIITLGVAKKGNLTAIEYLTLLMDKERQLKVRVYKNKNTLDIIEQQCKIYNSPKRKGRCK